MVNGRPKDEDLITFFSQEAVSAADKEVRDCAKRNDIKLLDAEAIKSQFDKYDEDKSGEIEKDEFKTLFLRLLGVKDPFDFPQKRLDTYWEYVDIDKSGAINFEEFLVWYYHLFGAPSSGSMLEPVQHLEGGSGKTNEISDFENKKMAKRRSTVFIYFRFFLSN